MSIKLTKNRVNCSGKLGRLQVNAVNRRPKNTNRLAVTVKNHTENYASSKNQKYHKLEARMNLLGKTTEETNNSEPSNKEIDSEAKLPSHLVRHVGKQTTQVTISFSEKLQQN